VVLFPPTPDEEPFEEEEEEGGTVAGLFPLLNNTHKQRNGCLVS
jgi:hypothetical protein